MIQKALRQGENPPETPLDPFGRTDIYKESLYAVGLVPVKETEMRIYSVDPAQADARAIVLPMEYGKSYEIRFPEGLARLAVVAAETDPRTLAIGEAMPAEEVRYVSGIPQKEDLKGLLYTPVKEREYLVIYTGEGKNTPIGIYEHVILAEKDTVGPWYKPEGVGDFLGKEGSFADYRWSSDEVYENLYEPLRAKYPSYIKREYLGKDQSGTYDMYCYIFEPENYEQSVFLSAGMHANEEEGYFALAYFMGEVANQDGTDAQLKYLREKVRFIVVPMINVFGVNQTHNLSKANWSIRYNSTETDLNRDFGAQTQQETKNVAALLEKYGADISFGIDFHTTPNDNGSDLFINFNIAKENAAVNFRTTNHMYHRMVEEGMITAKRPLLVPSSSVHGTLAAMDGKYASSNTLQAYLWNEHEIPPLTVEYMNFTSGKSPAKGSAEGLSMAVEIAGNFIIQNALFFAK